MANKAGSPSGKKSMLSWAAPSMAARWFPPAASTGPSNRAW
jgi:hypothetical protein